MTTTVEATYGRTDIETVGSIAFEEKAKSLSNDQRKADLKESDEREARWLRKSRGDFDGRLGITRRMMFSMSFSIGEVHTFADSFH